MDCIRTWLGVALLTTACGPAVATSDTDGDEGSSTSGDPTSTTSSVPPNPSTTSLPSTVTTTDPTSGPPPDTSGSGDASSSGDVTTGVQPCIGDECPVDVLVVVDNSRGLGGAQRALALAMVDLERQLRDLGADTQVMFTTTDMGNPLCTPFQPDGYEPASGAPITTACTERLDDFTGLGGNPEMVQAACTDVCPEALAPNDDPFVAFGPNGVNVQDDARVDVDGDGRPDSATARAMACMTPMGVNGCGFESPLEAMLQALNPDASWNQGPRPFLRDDAALGIVLLTDEYDCSVRNYDIMSNQDFFEISPNTGMPAASSAICWNAGLDCTDVGGGEYDCLPAADEDRLHPLERYRSWLSGYLSADLGKPVFMAGIVGVPAVTERLDAPPYTPTAGGVQDLVLRDWTEADVLPTESAVGVTAADKQFDFGIGPGCTNPESTSRPQGLPPVRAATLCQDIADDQGIDACCLESICDDDYSNAMRCLTGMFQVTQG